MVVYHSVLNMPQLIGVLLSVAGAFAIVYLQSNKKIEPEEDDTDRFMRAEV